MKLDALGIGLFFVGIMLTVFLFAAAHKRVTTGVIPPLTHAATDEYGLTKWH